MENLWMWVALICFVPGEWRSEDPSREWLLTGWGESEEIFGWTIWNSNIPKIHSFPNSKAFSYLIVLTYGYNANYFVVFMLALNQKLVCWKFLYIFSARAYGAATWTTSGHCNVPVQVHCFDFIELVEGKLGWFVPFVLNRKGIWVYACKINALSKLLAIKDWWFYRKMESTNLIVGWYDWF